MNKIFMSFLAVCLPWVVVFIHDDPMGALLALILQASIVGWPFASIWAWRIIHPVKKEH